MFSKGKEHCSTLRLMEERIVHPVKYNDEGKPTAAEFEYPKIYHNDAMAMEDYKFLNSSHVATYMNFPHPLIEAKFNPKTCTWAYGMNFFDLDAWTGENEVKDLGLLKWSQITYLSAVDCLSHSYSSKLQTDRANIIKLKHTCRREIVNAC
ncbi:hypothetical protein CUMW_260440 [Citrus unshiu]|uniref:Hexosyltransferase n=1 Tax=Citrus unshiu TaxID=55188 RepID=A0A2H5QTQ2_CITUN|nr:hypothetical protein CUMW_260440 [Citrus unshiu]